MSVTTKGFDAPPQGTPGTPSTSVYVQDGDPGVAAGPLALWITSAGVLSIRKLDNTGWIAVAGVAATPGIAAVLAAGDNAAGESLVALALLSATAIASNELEDHTNAFGTIGQLATALGAGGSPANGWTWQNPAAPPPPSSPLVNGVNGGEVEWFAAAGGAGGDAELKGGDAARAGATIIAKGGDSSGFSGQVLLSSGTGGAAITLDGNATDEIEFVMQGSPGVAGQVITSLGAWSHWADIPIPLPRIGAGVPSAAPVQGENGMAIDTSATTGGVYGWDGAAWIPQAGTT
jgi:hypothetical protein